MNRNKQAAQAPPWLLKALTPFVARTVARTMTKKYPGLDADAILAKMRAETGELDARSEQMLQAVARYLPDKSTTPLPNSQTKAVHWYSPSALVLIGANLIPLYGVIELGWPVFPILLLFWLENVVIGILNATRMLLADPRDIALWASKLFMVPFFCVHYGLFTAIHGTFVIQLFGGNSYRHIDHGLWPIESASRAIVDYQLGWAVLILATSHLFSLFWNYLGRGEYKRAAITELMQRPYRRVVMLHLTIILGGGITMALGSPVWGLVLLIALKIGFDLRAHIKEHHKALQLSLQG